MYKACSADLHGIRLCVMVCVLLLFGCLLCKAATADSSGPQMHMVIRSVHAASQLSSYCWLLRCLCNRFALCRQRLSTRKNMKSHVTSMLDYWVSSHGNWRQTVKPSIVTQLCEHALQVCRHWHSKGLGHSRKWLSGSSGRLAGSCSAHISSA